MGHLTYSNKRNDDEFVRGEISFSCGWFPTSSRRLGTQPFSTYRVLNIYVILSLTLPYHEFCCTFEASARGSCRVIYFDLRLNPKSVFVFNLVFFCGFFVEYLIISQKLLNAKKETAEFIELILVRDFYMSHWFTITKYLFHEIIKTQKNTYMQSL